MLNCGDCEASVDSIEFVFCGVKDSCSIELTLKQYILGT